MTGQPLEKGSAGEPTANPTRSLRIRWRLLTAREARRQSRMGGGPAMGAAPAATLAIGPPGSV